MYFILFSLPNLVADFGALLIALLIDRKFGIHHYARLWQRSILAISTYLIFQVVLFAIVDTFARNTYLSPGRMGYFDEIFIPTINPYTSALYFLLPVVLVIVLRRHILPSGTETVLKTSPLALLALGLITLTGISTPSYLALSHYLPETQAGNKRPEAADIAVFECSPELAWRVKRDEPEEPFAAETRQGSVFQYQSLSLELDGREVFRTDNGEDFWAFMSNRLNSVTNLFGEFPAGAPLITLVAYDTTSVDTAPAKGDYITKLMVSSKSGLSPERFGTAATCLFDHRDELHGLYASVAGTDITTEKLEWIALVDETEPPMQGSISGSSVVFSCPDGYHIGTEYDGVRILEPGQPWLTPDNRVNTIPLGFINQEGELLEWTGNPFSGTPGNPLDAKTIPTDITTCVNSQGISFDQFQKAIPSKITYYAR